MANVTELFSMDILKKKRKVVWLAFGCLYITFNEAVSNWNPDNRDDSKIWAFVELLREKADELAEMDEEVMNLLLQEKSVEEELDKEMQSLDNKYACNFEALDEEEICSRVPVLQPGSWLSELRDRGIEVLVEEERSIEVLIGDDIYGKFLRGRREILRCGLLAIETYIG